MQPKILHKTFLQLLAYSFFAFFSEYSFNKSKAVLILRLSFLGSGDFISFDFVAVAYALSEKKKLFLSFVI